MSRKTIININTKIECFDNSYENMNKLAKSLFRRDGEYASFCLDGIEEVDVYHSLPLVWWPSGLRCW